MNKQKDNLTDFAATIPLVVADAGQARMERLVRWLIVFATAEALVIAGIAAALMI